MTERSGRDTDPAAPVGYAVDGGVATITLQRPAAMNALDTATKVALRDALEAAAADPSVRCTVLTGTGRAFSVGQDLREHAADLATGAVAFRQTLPEHYHRIITALATMPKPVIAGVNGVAAGAGAAFTFAADVRIAAASAGFNLAFTAIGLSADSGSTWSLPQLVGMAKAKELLLLPRTISATEALAIGLVTEVVDDAEFPARVAEVAGILAAGPTVAFGAVRRALAYSASHDLAASLEHEAELMALTAGTGDHAQAVSAFLAKQPARFEGR